MFVLDSVVWTGAYNYGVPPFLAHFYRCTRALLLLAASCCSLLPLHSNQFWRFFKSPSKNVTLDHFIKNCIFEEKRPQY